METFPRLFDSLLLFVHNCFDPAVIGGYLSVLSRPGRVVLFFQQLAGEPLRRQAGCVAVNQRVSGLGRSIRPQPRHLHRMGCGEGAQGGLRPRRPVPHDFADFGLKKSLDHPAAVRHGKFLAVTGPLAAFQAQCLNIHVEFRLLDRLAFPIVIGRSRCLGSKSTTPT
jgi:hypothetical protein